VDKNGELVERFTISQYYDSWFSNGIVYQVTDGKQLYRLPSAQQNPRQKLFMKDYDQTYDVEKMRAETKDLRHHYPPPNRFLRLPHAVGDYGSEWIYAITYDGTCFQYFSKPNDPDRLAGQKFGDNSEDTELFKFDPDNRPRAMIHTTWMWPFINLETGKIYEFLPNKKKGTLEVYRWDNAN
jgi:hypothetical protein